MSVRWGGGAVVSSRNFQWIDPSTGDNHYAMLASYNDTGESALCVFLPGDDGPTLLNIPIEPLRYTLNVTTMEGFPGCFDHHHDEEGEAHDCCQPFGHPGPHFSDEWHHWHSDAANPVG